MAHAREKIVLIGAGSAMFTRGLVADLIKLGLETDLALVDIDPSALEVAERTVAKMIEARGAKVTLSALTDRRQALPGATVVITTIAVGGRRAWEQDVFVPREFNIYHPVGDSVGPGGTSRALRMVPAMVEIARDVAELAPKADFFNYANPMAVICRAVRKATGIEMVGLCHGVWAVTQYLADFIGADISELTATAVGMNHLTWFTELRLGGRDAFDRVRAELARQKARHADTSRAGAHFAEAGDTDDEGRPRYADSPFSWELFERFGAFPAVLDRHVVEFFPHYFGDGAYYGKKLGVDAFSFEDCIRHGDDIYEEMRAIALSPDPLPEDYFGKDSGEHEQVMEILRAIRTDSGALFSANLPNNGRLDMFAPETIIEAPVTATASGLKPIAVPPLSPGLAGTLASRFQWVEVTAEAALECGRDKFIQALVIDGYTTSLAEAERLADALLAAQAEHLRPFGWRI